ncbi:M20 metallopeptidase family protein [Nakamurella aerolata]|uniref:Amidohydrolase n=1 Tax=Nakamurella aerolata TaxID=1656892 RepID=A0A849A016_9ACTN|nr:M20 family metallopeptidase [Nakamurella aerolata]NNG34404.1 amidohydrolase [Nakamurella aerolata]
MPLIDDAKAMSDELSTLRRKLHAVPEVGLDLPVTQKILLDELADLGLEVSTGKDLTSITAVLRGGKHTDNSPVVLLRADMDALPVVEQSGESFAPAADSPHHQAMHACGHDMHMAGLIGAIRLLVQRRDELPGDVVFMLQPGEEGMDGARYMIDEGVLDAAGRRVDAAYGLHVFSGYFEKGTIAARPGALMAASAGLKVVVHGRGGHGSAPHMSADPVPAAAEMVTALQTAVTRQFNVFDPVVVTVGTFHAGTRRNIIPDDAEFEATIRAFSPEAMQKAGEVTTTVCKEIAAAHGLTADVTFTGEYPLTANNADEFEFVADTARDLLGDKRFLQMADPITGSEDFSRVLDEVPGCYFFVGAGRDPLAKAGSNHSPIAAFDDSLLPDCSALLAELAIRRLNRA